MEKIYVVYALNGDGKLANMVIVDNADEAKKAYNAMFEADCTNHLHIVNDDRVNFYTNLCLGYRVSALVNDMTPLNPMSL